MRLIDADALEELFREVIGGIAKEPEMTGNLEHMIRASATVVQMIQDAPTVERAEIVRCRDCKHRGNSKKCVLSAISEDKDFPLFMLDNRGDWFCADGERQEDR